MTFMPCVKCLEEEPEYGTMEWVQWDHSPCPHVPHVPTDAVLPPNAPIELRLGGNVLASFPHPDRGCIIDVLEAQCAFEFHDGVGIAGRCIRKRHHDGAHWLREPGASS